MSDVEVVIEAPIVAAGGWDASLYQAGGTAANFPDSTPPVGVLVRWGLAPKLWMVELGYRQSIGVWRVDSLTVGGSTGFVQASVALHTSDGRSPVFPYTLFSAGLSAGYADLRMFPVRLNVAGHIAFELGVAGRDGLRPRFGLRFDTTTVPFNYWSQSLNLPSGTANWSWYEANAGVRLVVGVKFPKVERVPGSE